MVRACLHCSGRENNDSEIYLEIVGIAPRLGPLAVAVQLPFQFLCGVVLLKLGGGVHLLHKAFLIRERVSADGSDGVKNQRPNRRCGDAVSKTFSCFLSGAPVPSRFKNHLLPVQF